MYKIDVYQPWCKKCGICIAFCPKHGIELDDMSYPIVKHPENCDGCKLCERRCPDFAIVVSEDKEDVDAKSSASRE